MAALSGNYVNFGVFELYGDRALVDALEIIVKMILSIPVADVLAFRKVLLLLFKMYFFLIRLLKLSGVSYENIPWNLFYDYILLVTLYILLCLLSIQVFLVLLFGNGHALLFDLEPFLCKVSWLISLIVSFSLLYPVLRLWIFSLFIFVYGVSLTFSIVYEMWFLLKIKSALINHEGI